MQEVRTFGQIPLAPQGFVFGKYADRMAVIHGIDMEIDNGHIADIVNECQPAGPTKQCSVCAGGDE